jgi:ABC-type glycerol-3-phosphate transport system substrate-binding protein
MTYREDLYQQAGLQIPKTWEEWKDTGRKLKKPPVRGGLPEPD